MIYKNLSDVTKFVADEIATRRKDDISFSLCADKPVTSDFLSLVIEDCPPLLMCINNINYQVQNLGLILEYRLNIAYTNVMPACVICVTDARDFKQAVLSSALLHRRELFVVFEEELSDGLLSMTKTFTKDPELLSCYLQSVRSEMKRIRGCAYCGLQMQLSYTCSYKEYRLRVAELNRAIIDIIHRSIISFVQHRQLMEKYSEVSSIAPVIENFMNSLNNTFFWKCNRERKIALLGARDGVVFVLRKNMDMAKRKYLLQMIAWDISDACASGKNVVVTILESKKKYGEEIALFLEQIDGCARVSLYADDLFMGHSEELQETIMGYFTNYIYSYHQSMKSCGIISKQCGEIPVVRNSYSCDRDRRIANNRLIDRVFNTNRVDHYVQHVPVWEPKFREEDIHSMPAGTCLVRTRYDEFFADIN